MPAKRVAIIGAGASGLTALKCALDGGLDAVSFERTGDIGGLWYFTPEIREGQACVMKSTVINTSKEMMSYSDFPVPQHFANFMHNTKVLEYFRLYASHFNLYKHIRFNTAVLELKRAADFASTGRWQLKIKEGDGEERTEIFDAVLLCSGHHAEKYIPKFPGAEEFTGEIVHPHDYKDYKKYIDKRAVIIGIGNSGGDTTVELSRACRQVYLSTRRGSWVVNRISDNGNPLDMVILRRATLGLQHVLPRKLVNFVGELKLNNRFNHEKYGLKPTHPPDAQHPTVNDELPNRIACGSVIVKPDIKRITKTGVKFVDGTSVEDIDVIISATGYTFGFPFLEKGVIKVDRNQVDLYKLVFPPGLEHPTLAVVGCFQPVGAINPIAEMQSRWAVHVFKGERTLPSQGNMWAEIYERREKMAKRYVASQRHTIQVDFIPYMDELATEIGCKPDLGRLLFEDPVLAYYVMFAPCAPYQYRLQGPNTWAGARNALMTQWERVYYPLKTTVTKQMPSDFVTSVVVPCVLLLLLAAFLHFVLGLF